MAVNLATPITIPAGCWRQSDESKETSDAGESTFNYILKGGYDALDALQDSLVQGQTVVTGWFANSWHLQRGKGNSGVLTITCVPDAGATEGQDPETLPLKEVWKIHAVRNDMSILAYCGISEGNNPLRRQIEMWQKETDGALADEYSFRKEDGSIEELTPASQKLAKKIAKGVESVVRFYPVLVRVRTYAAPPPDCLQGIGRVGTPPVGSSLGTAKKPGSLANRLNDFQWLKMQDDCDETADGKWTRTESWWGAESWDENFYGPNNVWDVPYEES